MRAGVTMVDPRDDVHRCRRRPARQGRLARPERRAARQDPDRRSTCASTPAACSPTSPSPTTRQHQAVLGARPRPRSAQRAQIGPFSALRPGLAHRRGRPHRQLRRDEEDARDGGREGQPPRLPRRRLDRREGQHRRRHDHVQLRRRRASTRRRSRRARSSAPIASSSRRSRSAAAPTSARARR